MKSQISLWKVELFILLSTNQIPLHQSHRKWMSELWSSCIETESFLLRIFFIIDAHKILKCTFWKYHLSLFYFMRDLEENIYENNPTTRYSIVVVRWKTQSKGYLKKRYTTTIAICAQTVILMRMDIQRSSCFGLYKKYQSLPQTDL